MTWFALVFFATGAWLGVAILLTRPPRYDVEVAKNEHHRMCDALAARPYRPGGAR